MNGTLLSVGYRGRTWEEVVDLLAPYRPLTVVDCRRSCARSPAMFRFKHLAFGFGVLGIGYEWPQGDLGNRGRRPGWLPADWDRAMVRVNEIAAALCEGRTVALLCAEQDANACHRSSIAACVSDEVWRRTGERPTVIHLGSNAAQADDRRRVRDEWEAKEA